MPSSSSLQRIVLLAPDRVARAAALQARALAEAWMLRQPRAVRRRYVHAVLDGPPHPHAQEIWMLGEPDEVRASYVREILRPAVTPLGPIQIDSVDQAAALLRDAPRGRERDSATPPS